MKIRPLQDRLIVKRVAEENKTKGGIIIPDTAKEKPLEGKVVAVGNGKVLEDGKVRSYELTPSAFGLEESDPAGLAGGTPDENARIALAVLGGGGPLAARNAVLMTAGAAIYVAGLAPDLKAATARAREVLTGGGATSVLETLRRITPRVDPATSAS